MARKLFALDMGSLCGWHYYANPDGDFGMLAALEGWLNELAQRFSPSHVVACFDGGNNFRNAIDPEYKIGRKTKPKPENFIAQLRKAPEIVQRLGFATARVDTFEADDLLATVVARFAEETEIVVVSEDKDLFCLVSDRVQQFAPRDGSFYDAAKVTEKLGIPAWRVPEYLAIAGDSSDGIKGIKGVGAVTAKYVIQNTRSTGEIFRKAAAGEFKDLKPATQKKLAEGRAEFDEAGEAARGRADGHGARRLRRSR
jgi:5'-3' exonuclease